VSSVIKVRRLSEEKAEFVGFTECKHDVLELDHRTLCGVVHELKCMLVVGLCKAMLVREPVERVAVETTDQIGVR
jgi:hypothetical protein